MDNQQDQFDTPNADNAGRTSQNSNPSAASSSTPTGASAASRKPASAPLSAESKAVIPNAEAENTANAGADRQGEGQQTNDQEGTILDTALNSGKKWIEDSGVLNSVNQLPQSIKALGNRALDKVNGLSTTQKVVGGAILAAGIGWLATRKGKSSSSSESSPYNYGRQRDAGYGRRSYGYQAPDASTSRRPEAGSGRSDSGAPYGNSGSRYGSNSYGSDASSTKSANAGVKSGSGRSDSSYGGASASTDHGAQHSSNSSHSKDEGFRSAE